jgi:hypothetical protein
MITFIHSRRAVAIVIAVVACAVTAYAFLAPVDRTIPPSPTLPEAYATAIKALKSESGTFYCLSASALTLSESSGPTEWHFIFYSTNSEYREVVVPTKGKITVHKQPASVY